MKQPENGAMASRAYVTHTNNDLQYNSITSHILYIQTIPKMKPAEIKKAFHNAQEQHAGQYAAFWKWFAEQQTAFYQILKQGDSETINDNFCDPLMDQLSQIREGCYFLAGIDNTDTAELIFTADGEIITIPFVEDLVAAAPEIPGWSFIASKPESDPNYTTIDLQGYTFSLENQYFYAIESPDFPDSIKITIIHNDYSEVPAIANTIIQGVYLFLDNYLGEVRSVTVIDSVTVQSPSKAEKELIPIEKLKSYLEWREKEFIEKYEDARYNERDDNYTSLTAQSQDGNPIMIMVNTGAMEWNHAVSHPWILKVNIKYDGENINGLPSSETNILMDVIEDDLLALLPVKDGHIYLGRETYEGNRYIYWACKDFRHAAKATDFVINHYSDQLEIGQDVYRDIYRLSISAFKPENWVENEGGEDNSEKNY